MDLLELFDDDDNEVIEFLNYQRRLFTVRKRIDHMTIWDDEDFRVRFRISKGVVLQVLGYIDDQISSQSERNLAVTSITKLLLTLRFYATVISLDAW
ncbi:unnamed protein product [Macrosiphum euphorbiae]|uniref:Uncharacterized protein n=1 Tax=Macrosiphum euphorbiae TaxID=13131 RepID=A0AAV0WJY0_9HEMI|nr:unnamed protein product [Macrosiphum euphorbiae]